MRCGLFIPCLLVRYSHLGDGDIGRLNLHPAVSGGVVVAALRPREELMAEAGAAVIVEQSTVLFSLTVVDITEEAIARVDAAGLQPDGAEPGQQ